MKNYSYKFRLYPTKTQEVLLAKHFGSCRFVYNHFLAKRIEQYKESGKSSNYFSDAAQLVELKKELVWLKDVGSHSLQHSLKHLQSAYDNFFRNLKRGKVGFPKFKSKAGKQSFKVPERVRVHNGRLVLPKFLEGIKIVLHREIEGKIKSCVVSKNKIGQYFVSILVEREIDSLPETSGQIGVDLNVLGVACSDGTSFENPRPEEANRDRLRMLSKAVSRCEIGSKGRKKAKKRLAKLKLYCHNVREDFLHKLSRRLINENQVICVEDLSVESMMFARDNKKRWLRRNLQDCGFASLLTKLAYKADWHGRTNVKVDRYFPSSQLCNNCKFQFKELPKDCKAWDCQNCGSRNNRDENSAKNILEEGLRIITAGTAGLADCPDVSPV